MRNWLYIFITMLLLGLPSCTQTDDMEIPTETKSEIRVNFTISFSEAASRALDESSKGALAGTAQENSINQYDFRMPVYYNDTEGTYFSEIIVQTIRGNDNGTEYTVAGVLKTNDISQVATTGIRVAVLANCGIPFNATFEGTTLKGLPTTYAYNFDPSFTIGQDRIPMVGISNALTSLSDAATNNLGQIDLLRAMAKVEVALDKDFTGYELTKVVLHNYNSKGYCSPISLTDISNNNGENNNPADTWLGLRLNIPETPGFVEGNITKESSNYIFYVPEYDNPETLDVVAADKKSYLTVTLKKTGDNATEDYNIYFSVYDNGEPTTEALDLKRNHYYQYNITGVSNNGLDLTLAVVPWVPNDDVLDYTENTVEYSVGKWSDDIQYDENDRTIVLLKTGVNVDPASYQFTLQTPKNAEWRAVLEGEQIRFHTGEGFSGEILGDDDTSKTIHGFTSSDNSEVIITLGVKAEDSNMSGQFSARLRFYVNLNNKWYEIDLVDGDESTLNHWTIKHLKSSLG